MRDHFRHTRQDWNLVGELLRLPAPAVVGFASGIDLTAGGRESVLNRYR
jgi:hypothetical protein